MVNRTPLLYLGLVCIACGGPNDETLVDELRVLSIITEPPEVAPGDDYTFQHLTHIPSGTAAERLTWTCTFDGTRCVESEVASRIDEWVHITEPNGVELQSQERMVPNSFAAALSEELPQLQIPLWTLACTPGLCPIVDAVRSAPEPDTEAWQALSEALANPFSWLSEYPKNGVSLATKNITVSLNPPEQRNVNPVITREATESIVVPRDDSVALTFTVTDEDPLTTFGYTTIGGFESTRDSAVSGPVVQTLFAPTDEPPTDSGTIYIIANDARGGSAVWTQSFTLSE